MAQLSVVQDVCPWDYMAKLGLFSMGNEDYKAELEPLNMVTEFTTVYHQPRERV